MDMEDTLIKACGSRLRGAFENLVVAHRAEASARLSALISIGAIAGPEGRHAVAEELRAVFAEMQAVAALGSRLSLADQGA